MMVDRRIVVVLGASNVSLALPDILAAFHRRLAGRIVDYYVAHGPGRSYGGWGGALGVRFVPHVGSSLVAAVVDRWAETGEPPVDVLITDVGNDIGAGVSSGRLTEWLEEIIQRFGEIGARLAVTALPVESLHQAPAWKFHVLRRLYFPFRCVPRRVILRRVSEVQERIEAMASDFGYEVLHGRAEWYSIDHIHLRRCHRSSAFGSWADALVGNLEPIARNGAGSLRAPSRWALPVECRVLGRRLRRRQPGIDVAPGAKLYLY